jgi:lambda family phage portal protein
MPIFKNPTENFIDKAVNFVSPTAGLKRREARMRNAYLNTIEPLKSSRRSKRNHSAQDQRGEDQVSANDRKYMHSIVRNLAKTNPMLRGAIERFVDNVIPPDGILPNATTGNKEFNRAAERYYMSRVEQDTLEVTNRFDFAMYQKILLNRTLSDGDFLTAFTNKRKIQGIESERIITPSIYSGQEGEKVFQGVRVNSEGAPVTYYVGFRNRYGTVINSKHRGVPHRLASFSYITDRIEEYRGTSIFLPVLDHFRDMQDIIAYEKFVMKMAACVGLKITPDDTGGNSNTPFPVSNSKEKEGTTQEINEMFPGQIFNLGKMGASDVEIVGSNRPGNNFENMMVLLARIAGVGIGLPIELILLDFNRGNMASVRAALLEARKRFYAHYAIVKRFCNKHYKWVVEQGVRDGALTVPREISNSYLDVEWSEPVWNWLDPLKEIQAEGLAIAYGFKTYEDVAKQRGKDWAQIAQKLGEQQQFYIEKGAQIIIGQPGAQILEDPEEKDQQTGNNGN